ncbi:16197_t:CDS:2, partial [Rhizophagus irregularis]
DLCNMNNIPLVAIIKDLTDFLTVSDRMVVNQDVQNANHRLKHALNLLIHRCKEIYEERDTLKGERDQSRKECDELQDEFKVQTGLLGLTQDELNIVRDTITGLEANLAELEREFGAIGDRNRALGELDAARNQLVYANNQVLFGIRILGRLRNRLFQQIATLRIQVQWFRIRQLNPPPPPLNHPQNTIWLPYINTVGIDPLDNTGAPPGWVRTIGVLRSCMRDEAARCFNAELTG